MIWVFTEPEQLNEHTVEITGPKGHHLARVLRVRPGEKGVAVCRNREYGFQVERVQGDRVLGRIREVRPVTSETIEVTLVQAVLPNPDFDAVVEAATALGVSRMVPVLAARSVARPPASRQRRWQAIAESAAEQSRRGRIPEVTPALDLQGALAYTTGSRLLILDPAGTTPLRSAIQDGTPHALAAGPEGGWTEEEVSRLAGAGGVRVSLGPRILRARLAPIAAVAILVDHVQAWAGGVTDR